MTQEGVEVELDEQLLFEGHHFTHRNTLLYYPGMRQPNRLTGRDTSPPRMSRKVVTLTKHSERPPAEGESTPEDAEQTRYLAIEAEVLGALAQHERPKAPPKAPTEDSEVRRLLSRIRPLPGLSRLFHHLPLADDKYDDRVGLHGLQLTAELRDPAVQWRTLTALEATVARRNEATDDEYANRRKRMFALMGELQPTVSPHAAFMREYEQRRLTDRIQVSTEKTLMKDLDRKIAATAAELERKAKADVSGFIKDDASAKRLESYRLAREARIQRMREEADALRQAEEDTHDDLEAVLRVRQQLEAEKKELLAVPAKDIGEREM